MRLLLGVAIYLCIACGSSGGGSDGEAQPAGGAAETGGTSGAGGAFPIGGTGGEVQTGGAAGLAGAAGSGDPRKLPPGGLAVADTPQFVVFGNDDNAFTGADGLGGLQFLVDLFDARTNPPGTGNAVTFDGAPTRFTMYPISTYIEARAKDSVTLVKTAWRAAYDAGHEVGNHTHTHPHGAAYTSAQWEEEVATCEAWLTKPWDPSDLASSAVGIGLGTADIVGFRSPYLEYDDALFGVLLAHGIEYDCSIEEGFESGQDGSNYFWPYALDAGSPGNPAVTAHPGIWELPVYAFIVPPDEACARYGVPVGLRHSVAARMPAGRTPPFDPADGKIRGLDWDLWADFDFTAAEFVATLEYSLDQRLAGNRAPFTIGMHTDFYHPESWGSSDMQGSTAAERQQALRDVFEYALAKPEVRIVRARDLLTWLRSPVAI
jgi:hypothetical protein